MKIKYRIKKHPDFYFVEVMNPDTCIYNVINASYDTLKQAQDGLRRYAERLKDPTIIEEGYIEI